MKSQIQKPSIEFYSYLQSAFDFFNDNLFDSKLSEVMFTITRKKHTAGFFRENGWQAEDGSRVHEIAMNPQAFITASPLEIYQTLIHEMCHQWQREHGRTNPRRNYHNKEWVEKMKSIGLEPISKNGKGTGQKVSDKPIIGGRFEKCCTDFFMMGYKLTIVDSEFDDSEKLNKYNTIIAQRLEVNPNSPAKDTVSLSNSLTREEAMVFYTSEEVTLDINLTMTDLYDVDMPASSDSHIKPSYNMKTTYKCPNCGYKLWGGANLPVGCFDCNTSLMIVLKG